MAKKGSPEEMYRSMAYQTDKWEIILAKYIELHVILVYYIENSTNIEYLNNMTA